MGSSVIVDPPLTLLFAGTTVVPTVFAVLAALGVRLCV